MGRIFSSGPFSIDLIPMEVDLVMKDGLKPDIGENILKEVVYA